MGFEWDEGKNRLNLDKHGLGFEEAALVFDDPLALCIPDPGSHEEQRWRTIGSISGIVVVVVAHTIREEGDAEIIRIISARRATTLERKLYEES